jgi:prephenate dehydrogenase
MTITIIGLGLIGGSLAIGLRENGFADRLIGVENNNAHAEKALKLGLIDEVETLQNAVNQSNIIIVATPVDALVSLLPKVLDLVNQQIVIEVGSTKRPILAAVNEHPKRNRFVATHPMAGTEYSGPEAAVRHLYTNKNCVLCNVSQSDEDAVKTTEKMYKSLFMKLIYMNAEEHDRHTAYISHLSHICSFALATTVLEKEKEEYHIFELASTGFDSTVRLAKSNPETWIPIFRQNQDNIIEVLDEYINNLLKFKGLMLAEGYTTLKKELLKANEIKRILR